MRRGFFEASPEVVAPLLLGKVLARRTRSGWLAGRIVEVEAYLGPHCDPPDPAAHSYRGPTPRNRVIFGPAGYAYVYSIYGRYFCMNVTCEIAGQAGCILVRALEPMAGMEQMARNRGLPPHGQRPNLTPASKKRSPGTPTVLGGPNLRPGALGRELTGGPSRLCQALDLDRLTHNGVDLLDRTSPLQLREDGFRVPEVLVTVRIGIRHAADLPLRFALPGCECVSGPKNLAATRLSLL